MSDFNREISRLSPEKRKLLEKILQQQKIDLHKKTILPVGRERNRFPLSYAQLRMWFLDQWQPGNSMYNNPAAVAVKGALDVIAMRRTLEALAARHEVLRTTFEPVDGQPVQVIHHTSRIALEELDLSSLSPAQQQQALERESLHEAQAPFDLRTGPLLRAKLIRTGHDEYVFLLTMHHIISDAWTLTMFIKEFAECYQAFCQNRQPNLPPLPLQYVDYAVWQRGYLQGEVLEQQVAYWREALTGTDEPLNLPLDHPRPKVQSFNGDVHYFHIDAETTAALETISRKNDVTLFMTLLAALNVLLHKYSGQDDVRIGTPIANRNRSEVELLLGVFVNTLVMRADLSGDPTFAELVGRVKSNALGAYAHQDIPFEMLVEELKPERDTSRPPFFQTMFVMQNAPSQPLHVAGVVLTPMSLHTPTAKFDLTFVLEPKDGLLDGQIVYNTDLFEQVTIERLGRHLYNLLAEIGRKGERKISELSLISDDERQELLVARNVQAHQPFRLEKLIHEMVAESAQRTPEARIVCGSKQIGYAELNERAERIARLLVENGVGPEDIVGVHLPRSLDLPTAFLAVLKAGGAFLPLDPDYPPERLTFMAADSQAKIILSHSAVSHIFRESGVRVIELDRVEEALTSLPDEPPQIPIQPSNPAYVIYTSGSTGVPKGVLVPHGAFAQHCLGMKDFYQLTADDRVLQFASTNFDAALEQIFPALIAGAELVMRDAEVWTPQELMRVIREQRLTVINLPTAYWNQFVAEWPGADHSLRLIIIGGDLMTTDSVELWEASLLRSARLLNAYGPTETVITSTIYDIRPSGQIHLDRGAVPIGSALLQRSLFILDRQGNPTPRGVPGELCIGGFALARGYLNRADLTAERFVPNPFYGSGERLYRTGDLVRINLRGEIEFLSRVDSQVKIRGYRIELGEIEAALNRHPNLRQVAVKVCGDAADKFLAAYYIANGAAPDAVELRAFLATGLPDYMIPSAFMRMDEMPLSPSGKIDRRALPTPEAQSSREYVAPRTESEQTIAEIVAEVLRIERVGVFDNFFELGGHSMLGTQVISRLRDEFAVDISLRHLFENPTVDGISRALAEAQAALINADDLAAMLAELQSSEE